MAAEAEHAAACIIKKLGQHPFQRVGRSPRVSAYPLTASHEAWQTSFRSLFAEHEEDDQWSKNRKSSRKAQINPSHNLHVRYWRTLTPLTYVGHSDWCNPTCSSRVGLEIERRSHELSLGQWHHGSISLVSPLACGLYFEYIGTSR